MRSLPQSFRGFRFAAALVTAAQFSLCGILFGGILMSRASGQAAGDAPQAPPEPPPPPVVFQNPIPSDQLAFLNDYAGHPASHVMRDKRFRNLMKTAIPRTEYHYGRDMPLYDTSQTLLDGPPLPVKVREGRYVTVASHGGPYLNGRGLLWFDIKEGIALGAVFFHPVNGEPTPTLAIFSRQLKETSLSMSQLPPAFADDLSHWARTVNIPFITTRYFIPDNGKKYVLVHDEDYCAHPDNMPAPPEDQCEQNNADAADIDLYAADFMAQTRNAANATAWMLSSAQVTWIGLRNQRCGVGPGQLSCRIQLTRQRTRTILVPHRK